MTLSDQQLDVVKRAFPELSKTCQRFLGGVVLCLIESSDLGKLIAQTCGPDVAFSGVIDLLAGGHAQLVQDPPGPLNLDSSFSIRLTAQGRAFALGVDPGAATRGTVH